MSDQPFLDRSTPPIRLIIEAVSAAFNVPARDICSARRAEATAEARYAACYLAKNLTDQTLTVIGRSFGGRDRSTVLLSIRESEKLVLSDPLFAEKVEAARIAALAMHGTDIAKALQPAQAIDCARMVLTDPYEAATRILPRDLAALAERVLGAEDVFADVVKLLRVIDELVLDQPSPERRQELDRVSKQLIPTVALALAELGHTKQETDHVHNAAQ